MQLLTYPVVFETDPESGWLLARFPDVPGAVTSGRDLEEARAQASDALAEAVAAHLEDGRVLLPGVAAPDQETIALDPEVAARLLLIRAMGEQSLTKVALAERLGRDEKAVRRILSGRGASLELTLDALRAVGLRPALAVPG